MIKTGWQLLIRLIHWRIMLTVRLMRAVWRNLGWVLLGAGLCYLLIIPLSVPVLIYLDYQRIAYSDETLARVATIVVGVFVTGGGYLGYRFGENRRLNTHP